MTKLAIAIFLVAFWLSFPVMAGYFDIGVNELDTKGLGTQPEESGVFNGIFSSITNTIGVYLATLTMTIPGVPAFFRFIIWIFQAISALVVYALLRG